LSSFENFFLCRWLAPMTLISAEDRAWLIPKVKRHSGKLRPG
jgi:hypothetical protein